MAKEKYLDDLEIAKVRPTLDEVFKFVNLNHPELFKSIDKDKKMSDEVLSGLKAAVDEYFQINK